MNELLLHVGTHKTGSSSIQASLDASRYILANYGVKVFPGRNHTVFYRAFTDAPENFHRYYRSWNKNTDQNKYRLQIKAYFQENTGFDHIVSAEDISLLSSGALSELKSFLRFECGITRIIVTCFLREPLDYLNSSLQQYIKPGLVTLNEIKTNSFSSYNLQGCPDFSGGLQNILSQIYFPIPLKLDKIFGEENVRFLKFEDSIKSGLVSSLLFTLDSLPDDIKIPLISSNHSISHEACILLSEFNNRNPLFFSNMEINSARVANRIPLIIRSIPGERARLVNPSFLDFISINHDIGKINSVAGFNVLSSIDFSNIVHEKLPDFSFSNQSLLYLNRLVNISTLNLPTTAVVVDQNKVTEINLLLERCHKHHWFSFFYKLIRSHML